MTTIVRSAEITSDDWVEIVTGATFVTVDLDQLLPDVLIQIGTELPDPDEVVDGLRLSADRRTYTFSGLEATDNVYARSLGAATTVLIVKS